MTDTSHATAELRAVTGTIFAVDQTATHDGPGLRMTVYLKGCPLHCVWCHSPESISTKPEVVWYEARCVQCGECVEICPEQLRSFERFAGEDDARGSCQRCGVCIETCTHGGLEMKGRTASAGEIADDAVRLKPFFDRSHGGITLTGGEPTLQTDFAYAVLALCREAGIHTAIETTGFTTWERLRRLATVTDLFLYDVKHGDDAAHQEYTGVPLDRILDNLQQLIAAGAQVIIRVPVIPGYNGTSDAIRLIATRARERGATQISLLPFNPSASGKYSWLQRRYPLESVKRQSDAEMRELESVAAAAGLTIVPS